MSTLNTYLQGLYEVEQTKTSSTTLEAELAQLSPDELLKIAVGDTPEGLSKLLAIQHRAADRMAPSPEGKIPSPEEWKKHHATGERAEKAIDRGIDRMQASSRAAQESAHVPRSGQASAVKGRSAGVVKRVVDRLRKLPTAAKIGIPVAAALGTTAAVMHHKKTASILAETAITKHASPEAEKLAWADQWGRMLAAMEMESRIEKLAYDIGPTGKSACMGVKTSDFEKQEDFTTPEAQEKAKVVQQALKATKGAPEHVRKAAVKVTAEKLKQASVKHAAYAPKVMSPPSPGGPGRRGSVVP